jgi:hypothetical protein
VADRVHDLAQVDFDRPPGLGGAAKEGLNPRPFLIDRITRIAVGFLLDIGRSAARRWGWRHKLELGERAPTQKRVRGKSVGAI